MAIAKFNELYERYFLDEMEKMCPVDDGFQVMKSRKKRFVVIAAMAISAIVYVGLSVSGMIVASINSKRVGDVQDNLYNLNDRLNLTELAQIKLRGDVKNLADELARHEIDFDQLKIKQVSTSYTISYITTRLVMGKQVIQKATRQWRKKKMLSGLMDFLNLKVMRTPLLCDENCHLSLGTAKACHISEDRSKLYMKFDVPLINQTLQLVEADPFNLMMINENKNCKVVYTGPTKAILSKELGCFYALNVKNPL
jgi:hypothetical protein